MCIRSLGSTLIPLDPKIERTACTLRKAVGVATLDDGILVEEKLSSSYDSEEEVTMEDAPPLPIGDYWKRTDE